MIEGVDYSDARPSPAGLVAVGKQFVGRYVGAGFGPKLLQADEAHSLLSAGLKIVSLVEGAADGALGGRSMGVQHAEQARQWHIDRGFPWPVPCYFAVDFDVQAAQWQTVRDYFQGVASTIGLPYTGIYGGLNAILWAQTDGIARWFMQTYAWSGGVWAGGVQIEQYHNDVGIVGGQVDLCRAPTSEYGGWIMGQPDLVPQQVDQTVWYVTELAHLHDVISGGAYHGEPLEMSVAIKAIEANVAAILAGLSKPIVTPPPASSTVDLTPVEVRLDSLMTSVAALDNTVTVDAVAIGKAMIADPTFVSALAAAVAGQLAAIQLSVTLSGSASGGIAPPKA